MKKIKLTREEQWIEDHLDEFVPASREQFELVKKAIERHRKDAVLNIRVNSYDLQAIKAKARKVGIKYQSYISEMLHRMAEAARG